MDGLIQTYFVADKVALEKVLLVDVHSTGLHPAIFPCAFVFWASLLVSVSTLAMPGNQVTWSSLLGYNIRGNVSAADII